MDFDLHELLEELKIMLLSIPEDSIDTDAVDSFISNALEPAMALCKEHNKKAHSDSVEMGAIGCTIHNLEKRSDPNASDAITYLKSIFR